MFRELSLQVRDHIVSSPCLVELLEPPVNMYRRFLVRYGSDQYTLTIGDMTATFRTETFDEIRHFKPVFSEFEELADLLNELRSDDIFYDIGAHIGIYTCMADCIIEDGVICAFEPLPANIDRIRDNIENNNVDANVLPYALSDSEGTTNFKVEDAVPGAVGRLGNDDTEEPIKVDTAAGNDIIPKEELPPPTIMKIDIEGSELRALEGLDGALDDCRLIYCEVSSSLQEFGDTREELLEYFGNRGFGVQRIGEGGADHYDIKASRER